MRWSLLATAVCLLSLAWTAAPASDEQWSPTALTDESFRLFTPTSGAFFALGAHDLMRSDDGGGTWSSVSLPPEKSAGARPGVTVNPVDHTQLFAEGLEGLYRSTD